MGLSEEDKLPTGIELRDAYTKIRNWYQANINLLEESKDEYSEISRNLILSMPEPSTATELEMRAVMGEIIYGKLEWAYHESDGQYNMAAYAHEAVKPFGGYSISEEDQEALKSSVLWPYVTPGKVAYYLRQGQELHAGGKFDEAERMFHQTLEVARKYDDRKGTFEALVALAGLFYEMKRLEEAISLYEQSLEISHSLKDEMGQQLALRGLGAAYQELGDLSRAEKFYESAVEINRRGMEKDADRFAQPLAETLLRLSELFRTAGRDNQAEATRQEANELYPAVPREVTWALALAAPTPKMVSDRWVKDDALGYEAYARTIATLITHDETVPPLTIGIKAPWGAGKTSLMKMVQYILDGDAAITEENRAERFNQEAGTDIKFKDILAGFKKDIRVDQLQPKASEKGRRYHISPRATIWFNPWKYQNSEQIWAGLAHCIISQVTARMTRENRERFWLKLHARRVDVDQIRYQIYALAWKKFLPLGLAYGVAFVMFLALSISWLGLTNLIPQIGALGIIGAGILNWLTKQAKFSEKVSGAFQNLILEPDYEGKAGFLHLVELDIREVLDLVATPKSPLVIFVDDLDRCAPNKVAEVVEAINLFLSGDYPNCIFVMGMEPGMVAAALEVANKDLIEKIHEFSLVEEQTPLGWRFMEKIIQLPLVIPPPTNPAVKGYVDVLIGRPDAGSLLAPTPQELLLPEENKVEAYMKEFKDAKSVAEVVQKTDKLLEESDSSDKTAIAEASKRMYSQKFKDRDPVIGRFIESATTLFQANPRQIKRYVNLFRFFSTLRHAITVDRSLCEGIRPELPSDEAMTKFVALCVHWPQATDCLRKMLDIKEEESPKAISLLAFLEAKARSLMTMDDEQADEAWTSFLKENGFNFGDWMSSRPFRHFLIKGESLAEGCGIW